MTRLITLFLVGAALLPQPGSRADEPRPLIAMPAGKWTIEFTNGVTESCHVFVWRGWHAVVEEPLRKSRGTVAGDGGSVVLMFHDDRVERWTPVGKKYVVEHWCPSAAYPSGRAVLGIAEPAK
jgi:hypothetical protein